MLRRALPWLSIALAITGTNWLRHHWIENAPVAQQCLAGAGGPGCALRAIAVVTFNGPWLTLTALFLAALALGWRRPWVAACAAAVGGVALVLYTAEVGAFTLLLGLLLLLRAQRHAKASMPQARD